MTHTHRCMSAKLPWCFGCVAALAALLVVLPAQSSATENEQPQPKETSSGPVRLLSPLYIVQTDTDGRRTLLALWGIKTISAPMPVYGMRAFDALRELVGTQIIVCTRYRVRPLDVERGHCRAGDVDINETLVRLGLALDEPSISGGRFAAAETEARRLKAGLWGGSLGFYFAP